MLIPTRSGNWAMEALASQPLFTPPDIHVWEEALAYDFGLCRGRVFADLWDLEQFKRCPRCFKSRRNRLLQLNLTQSVHACNALP